MAIEWNPKWGRAIGNLESRGSGGYDAIGPKTKKGNRAYGKYQVMDFNIPSWTKKHLGKSLTPAEFLANPEAQDAVFRGEFGNYVNKYGNPQDAASMWFTGKPLKVGANRTDILGTSGQGYVNKFNKELGLMANYKNKEIDLNAPMRVVGGQVRNYSKVGAPLGSKAIDNLDAGRLRPVRRSERLADLFAAQKPKTLLERFGIQKMDEDADGEAGQRFFNRDTFLNFLGGIGAVAASTPQARARAQATVEGRQARAQRNKTAEYLAEIGEDDLAEAVIKGSITGADAMQRVFNERDREYKAQQEEAIYQRDRRDAQTDYERDRADTIEDREAGYERGDVIYTRERQDALEDLATDMDFQERMLGLRTANAQELEKYKEELLRSRPITPYQRLQTNIALEQIKLNEDRLAEQALVNDANIAQKNATTEQLQLENEALRLENENAANPPAPIESSVEGPIVDPINIDTAAAGDPFGVGQRLLDVVRTNLLGMKGSSLLTEQSNLNAIDQLVRAGLSRNISDRGSVYSSQMLDRLLPSVGDSDAKMESKISDLIPILQQQLDLARDVVRNDVGSASQKGAARQVQAAFPDLIEALKLSQGTSTGLLPVPLDEDSKAVMDAADAIVGD